ncbi:hypothetical protein L0U85_15710 [Glycomyces sp. L485]|nr:hypothetical protein [Glycomyces sp. L485]MCH7232290.1 hypothetical protein [Glycomyces sp. L485]
MRYAGEIRTHGRVEGMEGEQEDAPFTVHILLRQDWARAVEAATCGLGL